MLKLTLCDVLESEFVALQNEALARTDGYNQCLAEADKSCRENGAPSYLELRAQHLKTAEQRENAPANDEDQEPGNNAGKTPDPEQLRMERLMKMLRTRERAALCFSGGGIRSATFGLGVLQGLSHHHLLSKFDYLSTVSGGGYIGSWLSAWRKRESIENIEKHLRNRPTAKLDGEISQVEHLRAYSNYLSPRVGLFSADSWTLAATVLRNMFLNWLIIVPMLAVVLLVPKLALTIMLALPQNEHLLEFLLVSGAAAGAAAVYNVGKRLPSLGGGSCSPKQYGQWVLAPLSASAIFLNTFWVLWYRAGKELSLLEYISFGAALHFVGWVAYLAAGGKGSAQRHAGLLFGAVVTGAAGGWAASLIAGLDALQPANHPARIVSLGFPMVMVIFLLSASLFTGFTSKETNDEDREWWARSGGWILIVACAWATASGLVLGGPALVGALIAAGHGKAAAGGGFLGLVSGVLGSLGGMSSKTDSHKDGDGRPAPFSSAWFLNLGLKLAPVAFLLALLIAISYLAERIVNRFASGYPPYLAVLSLMAAAWGLAWLMARYVNVNTFSLHAMYRSRLIRAYLGASNPNRKPNLFTGFDPHDNIRMHELASDRPFHVISMALNLVHGKRLAWQQRKAESFTATRLHCGSARVGYQPSERYGDRHSKGISLGTAMAISGAAASPNMGYHSSPLVTFLMTLFNARLGWWLANPGYPGKGLWQERGPKSAFRSLISEALGLTDDQNPWVYLSDGGHFENLGLYEMILRRCDTIVVVDAGADPGYQFEDLANALRKCRVDLGVTIHFDKPLDMRKGIAAGNVHCAIGHVGYDCADGGGVKNGTLIYLKPVLENTLSVDLDQYHSAHPDFPQQPTLDQFFDEAQFESYRRLGLETIDTICQKYPRQNMTLAQFIAEAGAHSGVKSARAVC